MLPTLTMQSNSSFSDHWTPWQNHSQRGILMLWKCFPDVIFNNALAVNNNRDASYISTTKTCFFPVSMKPHWTYIYEVVKTKFLAFIQIKYFLYISQKWIEPSIFKSLTFHFIILGKNTTFLNSISKFSHTTNYKYSILLQTLFCYYYYYIYKTM